MAARSKPDRADAPRAAAILRAALAVFTERGFAASRVEDVAARAGIAKGTVYVYFDSKEALLEAVIRSALMPALGKLEALLAAHDGSAEALLRGAVAVLQREILATDRKLVVRLVLTEAHRFPALAAFYHQEVVSRGLALLRGAVERGVASGEFARDTLVRFPQLMIAPLLLAVVWDSHFQRYEPLDTEALLQAHVDLVIAGLRRGGA